MSRWIALRRLAILLALTLVCGAPVAQRRSADPPILILVSFDGWRWDYIDRAIVPNLKALAARGVRAKGLIPSFPSLTFPNHYTLVTGLYPEHHGIVSNTVADPTFPERFRMSSPTVRDARWWGGEPIWVTAIRQNRIAMDMFWPGSEAPIGGVSPTRWWPFDGTVSNEERVTRVLDWFALPAAEQPAFVSLYFQEVDHIGHVNGPDSPEVMTAAGHLDTALGQLIAGVRRLGLEDRTTFVVVSDHGMAKHSDDQMIYLDDAVDPKSVDLISPGEFLQIAPRSGTVDDLYRVLRGKLQHITIYKRDQVPAALHYRGHPRMAPIVGVLDEGWLITTREAEARRRPDAEARGGLHGFDPKFQSMHGLFVAAGPDVRQGLVVAPFENIHVYDLLCSILKITPAKNDGHSSVTRGFLR